MPQRPKTELFSVKQSPSHLKKTRYFHSVATTHIRYSGNKRTSLLAFTVFVDTNGYPSIYQSKRWEITR